MLARSIIRRILWPPRNASAYSVKRTNVNAYLIASNHFSPGHACAAEFFANRQKRDRLITAWADTALANLLK